MKNKLNFRFLLKYLKKHIPLTIVAVFFTIAFAIVSRFIPMYVGQTIDCFSDLQNIDYSTFKLNLIYLTIFALSSALFSYIGRILINKISFLLTRDIRNDLYNHVVNLPMSYIDSHVHGDIVNRVITDGTNLSNSMITILSQLFSGLAIIVFTFVYMVAVNPVLGLIVGVLTPVSIFVSMFISKKTYKYFKLSSQTDAKQTAYINEMISRQKLISRFNYQEKSEEKFSNINNEYNKFNLKAIFASSTVNPTTRFINNIIYAVAAIACAFIVLGGKTAMTVGIMVTFLSYASDFGKPFNELTEAISEFQTFKVSLERIKELLGIETEDFNDAGLKIDSVDSIDLNNVNFSYVKDKQIIHDFSLNIPKGKKIAIVGTTGSGKTTVINLLMKFYDIDSGIININGINIDSICNKSLRDNISMVLQETWLISGTVFENIGIGKQNATEEEIITVAKLANADSFIRKLPNGYNTLISNDNDLLSEGERQLLCIARAMLADSEFLILDEATSSIDSRTEIKISEAFDKLTSNRTSIIIAHRLSTIKNSDVIVVMDEGRIVETGNHNDLIKANGFYSKLYNSQFVIS